MLQIIVSDLSLLSLSRISARLRVPIESVTSTFHYESLLYFSNKINEDERLVRRKLVRSFLWATY